MEWLATPLNGVYRPRMFKWRGRLVNKNSLEVVCDWISVETEHEVESLARNNAWIEFARRGIPVPQSSLEEMGWAYYVEVEKAE